MVVNALARQEQEASDASFERIMDGVLRDLAIMLLHDPDVQISCIAWKLHYTNSSAFTRSCQRWFGHSPREVRRRLLQNHTLKALEAS